MRRNIKFRLALAHAAYGRVNQAIDGLTRAQYGLLWEALADDDHTDALRVSIENHVSEQGLERPFNGLGKIDWASLFANIQKFLPIILQFITLFADGKPKSTPESV